MPARCDEAALCVLVPHRRGSRSRYQADLCRSWISSSPLVRAFAGPGSERVAHVSWCEVRPRTCDSATASHRSGMCLNQRIGSGASTIEGGSHSRHLNGGRTHRPLVRARQMDRPGFRTPPGRPCGHSTALHRCGSGVLLRTTVLADSPSHMRRVPDPGALPTGRGCPRRGRRLGRHDQETTTAVGRSARTPRVRASYPQTLLR